MSGANSFGSRLIMTSFGESHGPALGVVVDGVPAGIVWNAEILNKELARRRPGQSRVVSARAELDDVEILSGVYEGRTLGTPIAALVRNRDARSEDYESIAKKPRRGHADDVWKMKFGHTDPRGGGRSSGRETVARVIAGAIAKMFLTHVAPELKVTGFATQIGPFQLNEKDLANVMNESVDSFVARFPTGDQSQHVEKLLLEAKAQGRSYGGVAEIWVDGVPAGLGQPVFRKIKADLAAAALGLGATASFEIGEGAESSLAEGSEFHSSQDDVYGGVRGGITTGERLRYRVAFKPTSSVLDVAKKGRHDPCIVPRAIPVLEAMTAFVLADHYLWARGDRIECMSSQLLKN